MLQYILAVVLTVGFACAESSVYGFGSDDSSDDQTYSMQGSNSIVALKQQITQQNERIDGLTTIIEGMSASINELQIAKNEVASQANSETGNDALLKKLAGMIDEINQNYVTKQELQKALGGKHVVADSPRPSSMEKPVSLSNTNNAKVDDLEGQSIASLYNEGVRHYVKKQYAEAFKRFTLADKQGYKPAASNYYLGEISYYTNKYEDAIFYFKKSAGLYDQATYIDTLLLHTAISLENTGDKGQAKVFYENIIENYAGKKTAQIAKQRLNKL